MKLTMVKEWLKLCPIALCFFATVAPGAGVPDYRGKIILVIDNSMLQSSEVATKVGILIDDLVGDGWRVLRHNVDRGGTPGTAAWAIQVKSIRALIKADYDAAPGEVKSVFLIGHVAVPYSGNSEGIVGGHTEWKGAHPADLYYGEMTSTYGCQWSDSIESITGTPFPNIVGDGRFDQNVLPTSLELAVGRLDLSNMDSFYSAGVDEAKLIARYLNKNHDFRTGVFQVQRRGLTAGFAGGPFCGGASFSVAVGQNNVTAICDNQMHWFPNVKGNGQDYLLGYGAGWGWTVLAGHCAAGIGATSAIFSDPSVDWSVDSANNNFVDFDSRVVFVSLYGSYFGTWDIEDSFLRAPLANPYDPANGRYGYGLTTTWGGAGFNSVSFAKQAQGSTIGEAYFDSTILGLHTALMGDPTLRLHPVRPPAGLNASKTTTTVTLTWTHSLDAAGYKVYRAPTRKGPFTHVQDVGFVNNLTVNRPGSGPPDTFYMVRTIKTETTPVGSYQNMSAGSIVKLPGSNPSYLQIQNQPSSLVVNPGNPAGFSVDALGIDAVGNETITYLWHKGGTPIAANHPVIHGGNSRAISIGQVSANETGSYFVSLSVAGQNISSAVVSLTTKSPPVAQDDPTPVDVILGYVNYLDVLNNDWDAQHPLSTLEASVPVFPFAKTWSENGKLALKIDSTTIFTVPSPISFEYAASDGAGSSCATATIKVRPLVCKGIGTFPIFALTATGYPSPNSAQLYSSGDLETWSLYASYPMSSGSFNVYPSRAGLQWQFYSLKTDGECSGNTFGFIKKTVPPGWSTIGIPLDLSTINSVVTDNTLANVFKNVPVETQLQKYSGGTYFNYIFGPDANNNLIWMDLVGNPAGNVTLLPGDGAFIFNPSVNPLALEFVGTIPDGGRKTILPAGFSFISSAIPRVATLNELVDDFGLPAQFEDQIHRYDPSTQSWSIAIFDGADFVDFQTGLPVTGTLAMGETFFYFNAGSTAVTWNQPITVCPP